MARRCGFGEIGLRLIRKRIRVRIRFGHIHCNLRMDVILITTRSKLKKGTFQVRLIRKRINLGMVQFELVGFGFSVLLGDLKRRY